MNPRGCIAIASTTLCGTVKFKTRIEGLRELQSALQQLPKATGRNVLKRTLTSMADLFVNEAQPRSPEDTGVLKEPVTSSQKLTRRQRGASNRVKTANGYRSEAKTTVEMFVGPSAKGGQRAPPPSGVLQEFGTANQAPQPFMRPAWDLKKNDALEMAKRELAEQIDKAAKRLAAKAQRAARRSSN